jgi:hypothetical protein
MFQKSFRELAPSKVGEFDLDPSSGEEGDCMRLAKTRKLATSISIVHEFKPGQWGKVGVVTVHRAQKSREPVLKLGDVREVVDFPLRVDSEIDKKHKDKEHKRKAPSAVGCMLAMRNPPLARPGCTCGSSRCPGPCLAMRKEVEYKEYIDWLIRSKSTPIRSFTEYLEPLAWHAVAMV